MGTTWAQRATHPPYSSKFGSQDSEWEMEPLSLRSKCLNAFQHTWRWGGGGCSLFFCSSPKRVKAVFCCVSTFCCWSLMIIGSNCFFPLSEPFASEQFVGFHRVNKKQHRYSFSRYWLMDVPTHLLTQNYWRKASRKLHGLHHGSFMFLHF